MVSNVSSQPMVKVWEKKTTDIFDESIKNSRDLGQVRLNYSRLNMVTTLSKNEKEDWFKFNVVSTGNLRLTAVNLSAKDDENQSTEDAIDGAITDFQKAIDRFKAQGLTVEVYNFKNNRQTLLATNDEKKTKEYQSFERMMRGEEKITQKGMYYIHVTAKDGKPVKEDQLYALQLQMGNTYKHSYSSQEMSIDHTKLKPGDLAMAMAEEQQNASPTTGAMMNAQGASNILASGYSNMAQINSMSGQSVSGRLFSLIG